MNSVSSADTGQQQQRQSQLRRRVRCLVQRLPFNRNVRLRAASGGRRDGHQVAARDELTHEQTDAPDQPLSAIRQQRACK